MRLLFDARYIRQGMHDGISRYTVSLLQALRQLQKSNHPQAHDLDLVMLICDQKQLRVLPDFEHILLSSPTSIAEPFLALKINRFRPDVLFSPMQTIGSWGRKYKLVLTLHDLIYYDDPRAPEFLPAPVRWGWRLFHQSYLPQRLLLNRADAVVTVSQTSRQQIEQHRLTHQKVEVIPNAPPAVNWQPQAHKPLSTRDKKLIYMGSFMPYKNVETLLAAMKMLPDYKLHLLSPISLAREAELAQLAGSNVYFEHGVSDKKYRQFLAESTALLTASRNEGYGLPVVEAQAASCPTVISDIAIFREIAPHALHCHPDRPQEFAQPVRQLEDKDVRQYICRKARQDATAYSWQESALKLLQLTKNVGE